MTKVLFIHHGGDIGGAPVSLLKLAAGLHRPEFEPVVCFTGEGPIIEYARAWGVEAVLAPAKSSLLHCEHSTADLRKFVRFAVHFVPSRSSIRKVVRAVKPDIVHLNTSALFTAAVGVRAQGVPIVWHIREVIPPDSWLGRRLGNMICEMSSRVVVTSSVVGEVFTECPSHKKVLVPNAVDLKEFHASVHEQRAETRESWRVAPNDFAVGIVGSVQEVKGHFTLAEAARLLGANGHKDIRFIVVAGGVGPNYEKTWKGRVKGLLGLPSDNLERLRQVVGSLGLDEQFRFVGFTRDIPSVMAGLDVLAFPSREREGFGRPIIEAMAMRCPVIASDIGPSAEIMGPDSGILVPPSDPESLAEAILKLKSDVKSRVAMGEDGRKRVEEKFSLDRQVDAIQGIYRSVLQEV